ncbi:hypothetical protein MMC25_007734 [Agyrium rufum]|nr:hypothetical protein [Agyrium rufum]
MAPFVSAQVQGTEVIWSSVLVSLFGDRTPPLSSQFSALSPIGANQLFSSGSFFRQRYITPSETETPNNLVIYGISTYQVDNTQVVSRAYYDQFTTASGMAFVQGLYPPTQTLNQPVTYETMLGSMYQLADGSTVDFPLSGYQYSTIDTSSGLDPSSIWVAGMDSCPSYDAAKLEYLNSPGFYATALQTEAFYQTLFTNVFEGMVEETEINYRNAFDIYDYLNYNIVHNVTVNSRVSQDELYQAQIRASQWMYGVNGNNSVPENVNTMAGRALANYVIGLLSSNIDSDGNSNKINLLFTSYEPMVALTSLFDLAPLHNEFFGLPQLGSVLAFELYSILPPNATDITYPSVEDLQVRFLFRNGTNDTTALNAYPIFGHGDSDISMSYENFLGDMESIMIADVGDWCHQCGSQSQFCLGYDASGGASSGGVSSSSGSASSGSKISPAIAGVLGAIIMIAIAGFILGLAMLLFGFRLERRHKTGIVKTKRRSDLGGFKGSEKLASDPDLTVLSVKGKNDGAGATVIREGRGHERVGSWELNDNEGGRGVIRGIPKEIGDDGASVVERMGEHFESIKAVRPEERV